MKFDCFFTIAERVIRTAKVGICCLFCTFVSYPFCDTKRLLMKFDCLFIITERVTRIAKVVICFTFLHLFLLSLLRYWETADEIRLLFYNHRDSNTQCRSCICFFFLTFFSNLFCDTNKGTTDETRLLLCNHRDIVYALPSEPLFPVSLAILRDCSWNSISFL